MPTCCRTSHKWESSVRINTHFIRLASVRAKVELQKEHFDMVIFPKRWFKKKEQKVIIFQLVDNSKVPIFNVCLVQSSWATLTFSLIPVDKCLHLLSFSLLEYSSYISINDLKEEAPLIGKSNHTVY